MNNNQRKVLEEIISQVATIRDDEQDKYDNTPENLQGSEKYERISEGIDYLDEALDNLQSAIDC